MTLNFEPDGLWVYETFLWVGAGMRMLDIGPATLAAVEPGVFVYRGRPVEVSPRWVTSEARPSLACPLREQESVQVRVPRP